MTDRPTEPPAQPLQTASKRLLGSVTTQPVNPGLHRSLVTAASSVGAVLLALVICGALLAITGKNPFTVYDKMLETALTGDRLIEALQRATPITFATVAVALGFKMGLFNIGVEGQYLFAALIAPVVGAQVELPAVPHVAFILLVAMVSGAAWASIPAILKVKRNVNEVIATIMLNSIALAVIQWLFDEFFRDDSGNGLNVKTELLPTTAWMPQLTDGLTGMFLVAIAVLVIYWLLVFKSRFGFRLRASGLNPIAARTAGIASGRMIIAAMLISGGIAGLIAMPSVLGEIHAYGQGIPDGLGFAGIAVALLGRNHPVGILVAAFLFGLLDATAAPLQIAKVPNSIIDVIQAIIVLTVVIVNEAVTRRMNLRTTQRTASAIGEPSGTPVPAGATA